MHRFDLFDFCALPIWMFLIINFGLYVCYQRGSRVDRHFRIDQKGMRPKNSWGYFHEGILSDSLSRVKWDQKQHINISRVNTVSNRNSTWIYWRKTSTDDEKVYFVTKVLNHELVSNGFTSGWLTWGGYVYQEINLSKYDEGPVDEKDSR